MGEHRLKSREDNFLAIAGGQREIDPRLGGGYVPGDLVTFVRYDPATKAEGAEVTVKLTHIARFAPELFKRASDETLQGRYLLIGLSKATAAVVIPSSGAVALKAWPDNFAEIVQGGRVDLRARRPDIKRSSTILYQEFLPDTGAYSGAFAARAVRQLTPWRPADFYTAEQLREHGVAVLGWEGLEPAASKPEAPAQNLEQKVEGAE